MSYVWSINRIFADILKLNTIISRITRNSPLYPKFKLKKASEESLKNICMKKLSIILLVVLAFALAAKAQTVVFTNVNVIPMDKERVLMNQNVVVKDGVIVEVKRGAKIPTGAQVIDGRGKYLMPGMMDMHAHLLSDSDEFPDALAEDELKIFIAHGVTTARFMIGTPEQLVLRARSAKGEIIAPTIYAASPHLTGKKQGNDFVVTTEEQARDAVRRSKHAGYDFIKVTTAIEAKVYEAIVDEAVKQNIRVVGHADSRFVTVPRAWKAKQQIEHLDGYMEMLMPDATLNVSSAKGSVSDIYIYNVKNWDSLDVVDESKIPEIARRTVAANPFVNPTQHFMKNTFASARTEESIRAQPDFKFYPKKIQDTYINFQKKNKMLNEVPLAKRQKWMAIRAKMIKAIYDAGGKIMTGSDTPEFLWLYGFSQHREMRALSEAGLSNYAVLEAATINPSLFFGTGDKVGTIAKGRQADVILLNANPLENISATENRSGVMLKGKYYTQAEMNKWLDEAAPKMHAAGEEEKKSASLNGLEGYWEGAITREGKTWSMNLDVRKAGDVIKGFADFLDIEGYGREFSVTQTGDTFRLERPQPNNSPPLIFEGKVTGDNFSGKWSGINLTADFSLKRAAKKAVNFKEEEVTFKNGDVTLSGTLVLPASAQKVPVVVFTHGGGAETRGPNRAWAMRFVQRGIATLTFDKRGTGKSTGNFREASMETFADDLLAGVALVKTRIEIDPRRIGVAGHSQGGWVAPLAATRSADVAFVIASAASGVGPEKQSVFHVSNEMREAGHTPEQINLAKMLREKLYASGRLLLANDPTAKAEREKVSAELEKYNKEKWYEASELPPDLKNDNPPRGALELLYFAPRPMWEKVKVPVLLVWGDKDIYVPVDEGKVIIEGALKHNGKVTTRIFPNVNHGGVVVNDSKEWDFQRIAIDYYNFTADWAARIAR